MSVTTDTDGSRKRLTLTVAEAAELLGISVSAAYDCVHRGELPAIKMGRRWLIPVGRFEKLIAMEDAA